jgi:hypothetical protein
MIPRRTLLKLTGAALLTRPTALAAETPEGDTATITAYLDTLIPEDRLSPSASGVGIDTVIHRYIEASAQRAEFVAQGCRWLDEQARFQDADSFAAMPGEAREVIVASMASAPGDAAPRMFFELLRSYAMRLYYARPESWPSLGFDGPPQFDGFPDFDQSPAPR